jgi:hypothetical protein
MRHGKEVWSRSMPPPPSELRQRSRSEVWSLDSLLQPWFQKFCHAEEIRRVGGRGGGGGKVVIMLSDDECESV